MAARWWPRERRGSRPWPRLAAGLLVAALAFTGCAYLNTFYNAGQAYEEGERLRAAAPGDSLPTEARAAYERAAEKSAIVLSRHGDSGYADDALLLLGQSLHHLGSHADAGEVFRRYLVRFPDGDGAGRARLGMVRSERLLGDYEAARAALDLLLAADDGAGRAAEILYEKALIEQGRGAHAAAAATFAELLEAHPDYALDRGIALRFADAEMDARRFDAALATYATLRDSADDPALGRVAAVRMAEVQARAGRSADALVAYAEVLAAGLPDSMVAEVHARRGDLYAADSAWAEASREYRRVAEVDPGSAAAARATLRRGRIVLEVEEDRAAALDILLDAFLHLPSSAYGDSARAEARALASVLHYQRLAAGEGVVAGIEDARLARATALYRMGEEVLDAESDPGAAADVFARLAEEYPDSPWTPRALLAAGLLHIRSGSEAEGRTALRALVDRHPDTPEADSARRTLGLPLSDRPLDFYGATPELVALAAALPDAEDPMERIVDQIGRYADRGPATPPRDDGPRNRPRAGDRQALEPKDADGEPPPASPPLAEDDDFGNPTP